MGFSSAIFFILPRNFSLPQPKLRGRHSEFKDATGGHDEQAAIKNEIMK
jgi:hypothetical protein